MNELDRVIQESERFLREEIGAKKCRVVNIIDFMDIVAQHKLEDRVKVRYFNFESVPLTQTYVELNGGHVYSTVIS